jgi:hypothetical protein
LKNRGVASESEASNETFQLCLRASIVLPGQSCFIPLKLLGRNRTTRDDAR